MRYTVNILCFIFSSFLRSFSLVLFEVEETKIEEETDEKKKRLDLSRCKITLALSNLNTVINHRQQHQRS